MGIEGVVPKPVSEHGLIDRVAAVLRNPVRIVLAAKSERPRVMLEQPASPRVETGPSSEPPTPIDPVASEIRRLTARLGRVVAAEGAASPPPASREEPAPARFDPSDIKGPEAGQPLWTRSLPPDLLPPVQDCEAARRAAKARAEWLDALRAGGHERRAGADTARLDLSAAVAEHLAWLESQGARGRRANFEGKDLAGADLARTVLAGAGFRRGDLSNSALSQSRLDGADFRFARLEAADLAGAILAVAQLRHADLRLANLQGAYLRGADLSGARLEGALLDGADFEGVVLVETDLRGADLSGVANLLQEQIDKVLSDPSTRLPAGLIGATPAHFAG